MTLAETRIFVSSVDRDSIERLSQVQGSELTKALELTARDVIAKTVNQSAIEAELERRWGKWDFDGSVILGRIDTATRRLYVGTRRVLEAGDPILHSIEEPDVAELWAATSTDPGQALMMRHLCLDEWTITEPTTEFDHRAGHLTRDAQPRDRGHGLAELVDDLELQRSSVLDLLREAITTVEAGRMAPVEAPLAIGHWNVRLAEATRVAGTGPMTADLATLRAEAVRAGRQRRRDATEILRRVIQAYPDLAGVLRDMVDLPENVLTTIPNCLSERHDERLEPTCSGMDDPGLKTEPWL